MVAGFNYSVREPDEFFDEPDELGRIERILQSLSKESDPLVAAARAVSQIARSQAFAEGNKRTAVLAGVWILANNGLNARQFLPQDDLALGRLLFLAARETNVDEEVEELLTSRR